MVSSFSLKFFIELRMDDAGLFSVFVLSFGEKPSKKSADTSSESHIL